MRILWLCNMMPGAVREAVNGAQGRGGLWVDHVLADIRREGLRIHVLCPGQGEGQLDENCSYACFREGAPYVYLPELEEKFRQILKDYRPQVIHIWGTEYGHTLAMVNAAESLGLLPHLVISIQGLCCKEVAHFAEGVPYAIQKSYTFRDFIRRDNLLQQQAKFGKRALLEEAALKKAHHVIGRTRWDEACTRQINPDLTYHFCNETLRENFYEGQWTYEGCRRHRVFTSSFMFPRKGMHYLLEAFARILERYPDATLAVPGKSFIEADPLRQTRYHRWLAQLAKEYGIADKIEFLGTLSAEGMRQAFLEANVFTMPSAIENSPNSLGEAMILGVPCVSADVGGVADLMVHNQEGYVYQSTAPYMLTYYIDRIFSQQEEAAVVANAGKARAQRTHDPRKNLEDLLEIYRKLM